MAFSARVWPLTRVSGWILTSLKRRLLLPEPDKNWTAAAGTNRGRSKALPERSPGPTTAPVLKLSWPRAKELPLARRRPPAATTIWVALLLLVLLAAEAEKAVPVGCKRPPLPTVIWDSTAK